MRIVKSVSFPRWNQLPQEHSCRGRYRHHYIEPIREILSRRFPIADSGNQVGLIIAYELTDGRRVRAHLCYSDDPLGCLLGAEHVDVVLKMKYHESCIGFYEAHSVPVRPAGYITGPQPPDATPENRAWLWDGVARLREIRDQHEDSTELLARDVFRNAGVVERIPAPRKEFMDRSLGSDGRIPFREHVEQVARSKFVLNVCGPFNSIDRKVVEYCAIGSAIISTRGLADLILPGGSRFRHGHNVWLVDKKEDIATAIKTIDEPTRQRLVDGSRMLWDKVFEPKTLAHWWETLAVNAT